MVSGFLVNWVHVLAVHHHYHPELGTQIAVWEESGQEREHGGKPPYSGPWFLSRLLALAREQFGGMGASMLGSGT